jgi:phosphoribosylformylglycinamidine cyclo-ligase
MAMTDSYSRAGVDTAQAARAVDALVAVLRTIDPGRPSRAAIGPGHYASVIEIAPNLGVALCTDGVGSKVLVAEQAGRFDTVGIDCIAMNVNDLVCVGAEPLALLDYLAVQHAEPELLQGVARGLKAGAEAAGIEIPGGELAQLPELIRGRLDIVGAAFGTVALDAIVTGTACAPGDALIGLPSTGVHSNGLTLARRALLEDGGLRLGDRPDELDGPTVADALLEPTAIYVRAVLELLHSDVPVHGLAHITGDGVLNLLRLEAEVGFEIDTPLPVPGVFGLIAARGGIDAAEMWRVFNMGCGFVCVVPAERADESVALLSAHHPGAARIGTLTDHSGTLALPSAGLAGDAGGLRPASH